MLRPSLVVNETSSGSATFGPLAPLAVAAAAGVLGGAAGVFCGGAGVFCGGTGVFPGGAPVLGGANGVFLLAGGAWPKPGSVKATTNPQTITRKLPIEIPAPINRNSRPNRNSVAPLSALP